MIYFILGYVVFLLLLFVYVFTLDSRLKTLETQIQALKKPQS